MIQSLYESLTGCLYENVLIRTASEGVFSSFNSPLSGGNTLCEKENVLRCANFLSASGAVPLIEWNVADMCVFGSLLSIANDQVSFLTLPCD